jgi:hypothetical protein
MTKHLGRGVERFHVVAHRPVSVAAFTKGKAVRRTAAGLIVARTSRILATKPVTRLDQKLRAAATRFR